MKFKTFCEFFASIESNPGQIVNDFTVADYLGARLHIKECEKCTDCADRVNARYPDGDEGEVPIGLN